jgi:hypothetical protein
MATEDEQQVWCKDCNCYLYSNDRLPGAIEVVLVNCPCTKDCLGKCTWLMSDHRPVSKRTYYHHRKRRIAHESVVCKSSALPL